MLGPKVVVVCLLATTLSAVDDAVLRCDLKTLRTFKAISDICLSRSVRAARDSSLLTTRLDFSRRQSFWDSSACLSGSGRATYPRTTPDCLRDRLRPSSPARQSHMLHSHIDVAT